MASRSARLEDELLVLACREGDEGSFRTLVSRWQEPLWRHASPERARGPDLDWMTTYVVDAAGVVREILPIHRGMPLPWDVVLESLDRLED